MIPAPINGTGGRNKVVTPIKRVEPVREVVAETVAKPAPLTPEQIETPVETSGPALTAADGSIRPMWKIEREAIQNAINHCDGNVLNAAVLLELSPSTVYRKKQAWEAEDEYNQA